MSVGGGPRGMAGLILCSLLFDSLLTFVGRFGRTNHSIVRRAHAKSLFVSFFHILSTCVGDGQARRRNDICSNRSLICTSSE